MGILHCYQSKHQLKVTVKEPLNLTKKNHVEILYKEST